MFSARPSGDPESTHKDLGEEGAPVGSCDRTAAPEHEEGVLRHGEGGALGMQMLGTLAKVTELRPHARHRDEVSWSPHFTEEEARLRKAKRFV